MFRVRLNAPWRAASTQIRPLALVTLVLGAYAVHDAGDLLAADAEKGKTVAEAWCAECHLVAPEQTETRSVDAPSFALIAARRDEAFLRAFLAEQHLPMPTFRLFDAEKADVIAYIATLAPDR